MSQDQEKADMLDICIAIIKDHEKKLDALAERLENIARKMEMYQP